MRKENGQTLVHVALMMVVLLGFLALAIDVGLLYFERRRMQNAADAGALAGAREICLEPKMFPPDGDPYLAAQEYAVDRNFAPTADITVEEWTVTVVASSWVDLFFARIFGMDMVHVGAVAAAACGKANSACNVWPITYSTANWGGQGCGDWFLLWDSWNDNQADCEVWNCDIDGYGDDELPLDRRTWADFTAVMADGANDPCDQSGCGNAELRDRLIGATCRSWIELESCMAGDMGIKKDSWKTAIDQTGRVVSFPLYSSTGCIMPHDPGNACGNERYWITAFGCVRVLGGVKLCQQADPLCTGAWPWPDADPGPGPWVIVVEVLCPGMEGYEDCATDCGGLGPDPEAPGPGDVVAVGLIR